MTGYHVTTRKKLQRYLETGIILPPVRFWASIEDAERFSKQTGRRIILRLTVPESAIHRLSGHRGRAYWSRDGIVLRDL